jgi:hypothetical protein
VGSARTRGTRMARGRSPPPQRPRPSSAAGEPVPSPTRLPPHLPVAAAWAAGPRQRSPRACGGRPLEGGRWIRWGLEEVVAARGLAACAGVVAGWSSGGLAGGGQRREERVLSERPRGDVELPHWLQSRVRPSGNGVLGQLLQQSSVSVRWARACALSPWQNGWVPSCRDFWELISVFLASPNFLIVAASRFEKCSSKRRLSSKI